MHTVSTKFIFTILHSCNSHGKLLWPKVPTYLMILLASIPDAHPAKEIYSFSSKWRTIQLIWTVKQIGGILSKVQALLTNSASFRTLWDVFKHTKWSNEFVCPCWRLWKSNGKDEENARIYNFYRQMPSYIHITLNITDQKTQESSVFYVGKMFLWYM